MADSNCTLEEWRVIQYAPDYEVSSSGLVRRIVKSKNNVKAGKIRRSCVNKTAGHLTMHLRVNGKVVFDYVHRIVARTFLGDRAAEGLMVCHKNGNPQDNRVENLYWGTYRTNGIDMVKHGNSATAKLSEIAVQNIRELCAMGVSKKVLAEKYGVSKIAIYRVANRETWGHVCALPTG